MKIIKASQIKNETKLEPSIVVASEKYQSDEEEIKQAIKIGVPVFVIGYAFAMASFYVMFALKFG